MTVNDTNINPITRRPTVAVVMCTFNGEKYLAEQLDSILDQTYPVSELIIQDDCSTDGTVDIIRRYMRAHEFIKLFVNERNLGFNANFHLALTRATAQYIAISDQDDVWYPTKLERQIAAIGDRDLCATAYDMGSSRDTARYVAASDRLERFIFGGGVAAGHTMLLSRGLLDGRSRVIPGITYDWNLLMNAHFGRGVVVLQEPLNWHRRHAAALGNVFHKSDGNRLAAAVAPYLFGWKHYRRLQRKANWRRMYAYIVENTDPHREPVAHSIATLMLQPGAKALLRLCLKCVKYKFLVYPDRRKAAGLMGSVRAFAFPAIFAYNNHYFDWAD